jgi:hypothetical protein
MNYFPSTTLNRTRLGVSFVATSLFLVFSLKHLIPFPLLHFPTVPVAAPIPLTLYVSTDGDDARSGLAPSWTGVDGPLRSLEGARNRIRRMKATVGLPPGGVVVEVEKGTYRLSHPFLLTAEDAGTLASPITYQAAPNATVIVSGAKTVPPSTFGPVPTNSPIWARLPSVARTHVLQANLLDQGFTVEELGIMSIRGTTGEPLSHSELFYQKLSKPLARWPNNGELLISPLPDSSGRFIKLDTEPGSDWTGETDIWAHGYWYWDWSDFYMPMQSADWGNKLVTAKIPILTPYPIRAGQRVHFLNVLAELDTPGEWYLDRVSGILYFWPPAPLTEGDVEMSVATELKRLDNTSHVTLSGFTYEMSRGTGIVIQGGSDNHVENCIVRGIGNLAVDISGTNSGISGSELYDLAESAIKLTGGDRQTLTSGGLFADYNHIHNFGRWARTNRTAVELQGVGNRCSHNLIHDAPHRAIFFQGNNHLIEYNDISNVVNETNDAGAIYTGRNWTERGTTIQYNYLHDIQGYGPDVSGVYLDDQASGSIVRGNIFFRVSRAFLVGGGVDNQFVNNLVMECTTGGTYMDARGLVKSCVENNVPVSCLLSYLKGKLGEVPYKTPPWSTHYPTLPGILDDDPDTPKRNKIEHNIFYHCAGYGWFNHYQWGGYEDVLALSSLTPNLTNQDPQFLYPERLGNGQSPAATDFVLQANSPAYGSDIGFVPLPFSQIGPVGDVTPPSVPTGITSPEISSTSVKFTWTLSRDNVGVTGYLLDVSSSTTFSTFVPGYQNADVGNVTGQLIQNLNSSTVYYARVRAKDAAGNLSEFSPRTSDQTLPETTPPTVALSVPGAGSPYTTPQMVGITATAVDNVGITKVRFTLNGATVYEDTTARSSYSYSWPITTANNGDNRWSFTAFDAAGNSATTETVAVTVNIDVTKPSISLTDPLPSTRFTAPQTVAVTANATDNVGVAKVWFTLGNVVVSTVNTPGPSYQYNWLITAADNGNYSWSATAFDAMNNSSTTVSVPITIDIDVTQPYIALTSPAPPDDVHGGANRRHYGECHGQCECGKSVVYLRRRRRVHHHCSTQSL